MSQLRLSAEAGLIWDRIKGGMIARPKIVISEVDEILSAL